MREAAVGPEFPWGQQAFVAAAIDDPCRVYLDTHLLAPGGLGARASIGTALDVGQAMGRCPEDPFLVLAVRAPH
ncbi:MAG: hypothetical protein ACREJW_09850, partial [Candidatus Methylomirabilales bacterium]